MIDSIVRLRSAIRSPGIVAVATVALVLVGCGGGGDSGGATATTTASSAGVSSSSSSVASSSSSSTPTSFSLSGSVSGLINPGLVLANGADTLAIAASAGTFTLSASVAAGTSYTLTVANQPVGENCVVTNGSGTMPAANVSNVAVSCSLLSFSLSGTVSGLASSGLVLANGTVTLPVAANATAFSFALPLPFGSSYNVTVQTQPTGLTCAVANGAGAIGANVTNVVVSCTPNPYTLGGTITGLTTGGLVLANGATTLSVAANATTFTLPGTVTFGSPYNVTVQTQPTGRACTVSNGSGTLGAGNVLSINVTCTANNYTVSGTISGLTASGLLLANGASTVSVAANATAFTLPGTVAFGGTYNITVQAQPTGLTCTVLNGSGTMGAANVVNVSIACTIATYTLGGTIAGLTTSGLVLANGATTLSMPANATTFTLPGTVAFGSSYSVTVQTQPANAVCSITNGSGTVGAANITNVVVTCVANHSLGGTISGLTTAGLVLANGATTLSVAANATTFTMPGTLPPGTTYNISVQTQPTGRVCTLTNASGTMGTVDVTNVVVTCVAATFTVGGSISGLGVSGLVLANGASTLSVASSATTFTMPGTVTYGGSYSITVQTQPTGRTCTVSNGSGTNISANVTNVVVSCSPSAVYTVGGTITGLTTGGLVLANGATTLSVAANATSFTMPGSLATGITYNIVVQTQPTGRTCSVANGSGTVASANVTNIAVTCVANGSYTLSGTISGLGSATGMLLANGGDTLSVAAGSTSFMMPTSVAYLAPYSITVNNEPTGLHCSVGNGNGTMPAANVTNITVTCSAASIALQPRDLDGNAATIEAYYDPALNITWLKNSAAGAGSAYDNGKFSNDGRMTWSNAMAWAASLSFPAPGAGSGWRLPTMIDTGEPDCGSEFSLTGNTSCGQNVYTTPGTPTNYSEMAHLFQVTLGNSPAYNTGGGLNPPPWLANIGPFTTIYQGYNVVWYVSSACGSDFRNCRDDAYWTNVSGVTGGGTSAWKFLFGEGEQIGDSKNVEFFAWAVHDGDVGNH